MNVKQGDLAILIKSSCGNEGVVGVVGEYLAPNEIFICENGILRKWFPEPGWMIRFPRPVMGSCGVSQITFIVCDSWLRPVSGLPIEEETKQTEEAWV
jgi:hypothetical protein